MSPQDRKAYWRFDRDETSRVSTERTADRQPESDTHSPVKWETKRGPLNASVLRDAIDRGRTGDKVAHPDPAAAPLSTDDEAAGTTPTPERVATAMRHETRAPAASEEQSRGSHWVMIALIVAGAAALAIAVFSMAF